MINGKGWITQNKYGCQKKRLDHKYIDLKSLPGRLPAEILRYPIANFLRFDRVSKFVTISIALALHDANIIYSADKKQPVSILYTNTHAALKANLTYFIDYITNGRTLARGNLFIYTLPSSPLAEAAIHFGFTGKLLYLGFTKNLRSESLKYALNMLKSENNKTIILVNSNPKITTCYILQK